MVMPRPDTRQRLLDMRAGLLADLDRQIEPRQLALLGGVTAALAALKTETVAAELGTRAIVSDDGSTIWLTALAPVRAVALAGELIEAAVPKLARPISSPTLPRGPSWGICR